MNKTIRTLAIAVSVLGFTGAAYALDIEVTPNNTGKTIVNGTVVDTSRVLNSDLNDAQRETYLRYGDCLKANGGRITPRCAALRDTAVAERSTAAGLMPAATMSSISSPKSPTGL